MSFFNFLFPRYCLGCGREDNYFCPNCQKRIKPLNSWICPICEKPAIDGLTHPRCQNRYSMDGLISLFPYAGLIKTAIGKLKYHFMTDLVEDLSALMMRIVEANKDQVKLLNYLKKDDKSILLPVPLYWQRENWRGFNQAELLGEKLAKHFGWQIRTDILIRQKRTQPQMSLKANKRQENIHGVFKVNQNNQASILNSKLILFDDVWTTGLTLKEAAKTLKKAGFKKVFGLTICR